MDIHILVPPAFHEKLKCYLCKNYLSHFPISVCSNNKSICGRCTVPEGRISYQDEALETICQFLKFPCRYRSEGCPEEVTPKDVPQHEENCSYRIVSCFISKPVQCKWKGSLPTLLPHSQTDHTDMILKNGEFQMDLALSETTENLIEYDKHVLVFTRKFNRRSKILYCAVHNLYQAEGESYACELSVTGANNLTLHFNTTSFKERVLASLSLKAIAEEALLCKITVRKAEAESPQVSTEANLELLELLKCCECSDFAVAPVYHCIETMKTVCSACKISHSRNCRSCNKSSDHRLRNLDRDKIADLVDYPCKYREKGCLHSYKFEDFICHYYVCEYRDEVCPFFEFDLCKWEGLHKDVCDHVVNNHGEIMLESSEALVLSLEKKTPQCYFIRFSNRLFRLVFCVGKDGRVMWSIQMIGCYEKGFKFAIDILDTSNGKMLLLSRDCWPVSKTSNLFKNFMTYCYFLKDQILGFTNEDQVTFKVHIFK